MNRWACGRFEVGSIKDVLTMPAGLYCSGWVKTGPAGAILNTMSSAYETAESIIDDYNTGRSI